MTSSILAALLLSATPVAPAPATAEQCVACHEKRSPGVVADWKLSRHAQVAVACDACHGSAHHTDADFAQAKLPTPDTCNQCHSPQVEQFKKGKHSAAWAAMKAMPTFHQQPMAAMEGLKGCGGCHKLGLKSEAETRDLVKSTGGHGDASCDACHTRHTFSKKEALQPQACETCHMGFDHPQWEMYSGSKHGVRHGLKQLGVLPPSAAAPTCQDCHMKGGNHEVRTAWGFLAVRLPLSDDPRWKADQVAILQGLQVLDPKGQPTGRLDLVKAADVARLTQGAFDKERQKMLETCAQCHSPAFAKSELARSDDMVREADHLMAEAIREVAALYQEGVIAKPKEAAYPFPDLLTFHDAGTVVEQKLFVMFLEHRMRTFQGSFHNNPDYALWYGWSEMQRDLAEIRALAAEMRRAAAGEKKAKPAGKQA
ncbi:MAG TPA: multiheme c-type cytochrome [Anaeromyxobacteraceae bacterium]|nr:multiheme c-type cytochrome [Anaeromyxobacteraceae bacterium]